MSDIETPNNDTPTLTPDQTVVGYEALCKTVEDNEGLLLIVSTFHLTPEELKEFSIPTKVTDPESVFDLYALELNEDQSFDELYQEKILPVREMATWQLMYLVDPGRSITSLVFPQGQSMPDQQASNTYNILNYNLATLVRDTALDATQETKDGLSENFPALKGAFEVCQTQYRVFFDHRQTSFSVLNVDTFTPLPIKDVVCVQDVITQTTLMIDPRRAVDFTPLGKDIDTPSLGGGILIPPMEEKGREVGRYYGYITGAEGQHVLMDLVTGLTLAVSDDALGELMYLPFDQALQSSKPDTANDTTWWV